MWLTDTPPILSRTVEVTPAVTEVTLSTLHPFYPFHAV
jgi:hypothetical protein